MLKRFKDYFIPIVDHNKRVIDVIKPIHAKKNLNYCDVLILAGGFGKRLLPITSEKPKPLISLNKNTTILGQIIDSLQSQGFLNLNVSTYYLADQIVKYLDDNYIGINVLLEKDELGTAGPLLNFYNKNTEITETILLINGDVLTDLNFKNVSDFHNKNKADITVVTSYEDINLKYGEIILKRNKVVDIIEKPKKKFLINAGIYLINSKILKYVNNKNKYFMDELIKFSISKYLKVINYTHEGYFLDLGTKDNLERAKILYSP